MSADCTRKCNARTCKCPPTAGHFERLARSEVDYIVAERRGLRLDSLCSSCPSRDRCIAEGLRCSPEVSS